MLNILSELVYYNFIWVLLATFVFLLVRAIRWKIIIGSLKDVTIISSLANISIGLMANNLLPARSGELVRVASFARTEKISASGVLSSLILERLLDGFILLLLFALSSYKVSLIHGPGVMDGLRKAALAAFIIYSCVLSGLMIFMKYGTSHRFKKIIPMKLHFLEAKLEEFKSGLDILTDFRRMAVICFLSVIIWLLSAFIIIATLSMFLRIQPDIYNNVGFIESIFLNGAVSLALMIPAAPGFFGSFHLACTLVVAGLGVTRTLSDSFAIFIHSSQYLLITLTGLVFFMHNHLLYRKIAETKNPGFI